VIILDIRNHCELKDTFQKIKTYPYKLSSLNILTKKTSLFLLDYFQEILKIMKKVNYTNQRKKHNAN